MAGHGKWANENDKIADVIGDSKEFTAKELVDEMYEKGYRDGQDVWIIACNSAKKGRAKKGRSGKKSLTQRVYEELKRRTESGDIGNVEGYTGGVGFKWENGPGLPWNHFSKIAPDEGSVRERYRPEDSND